MSTAGDQPIVTLEIIVSRWRALQLTYDETASDEEAQPFFDAAMELEDRIIDTPATNAPEFLAKLDVLEREMTDSIGGREDLYIAERLVLSVIADARRLLGS